MRVFLILAALGALLAPAATFAAQPVTINNAANTRTASIDSSSNLNVNCQTGCSGGGGGGAVYGPTANGSPAANPPVLIGGTATGGAAGNVENVKVDTSGNLYTLSALQAGSALVGKVGIDQTTPGTTNNVTVSTNVGTLPLVQATASVSITFTAAGGPTQIIAASGSTKIYITHIHYVLSGAGTFALVTGTGTNCGTGTTYLEGASGHPLSYAANGGISAGSGLGPIYITGAGGEVCAITTGSVDTSGDIAYAQF